VSNIFVRLAPELTPVLEDPAGIIDRVNAPDSPTRVLLCGIRAAGLGARALRCRGFPGTTVPSVVEGLQVLTVTWRSILFPPSNASFARRENIRENMFPSNNVTTSQQLTILIKITVLCNKS